MVTQTLLLEPRDVPLGGARAMLVRRTLPHREIRTIGAWCFVDHFGPDPDPDTSMQVPPHPHMGLQTVTWLVNGDIVHRDSIGSHQLVRAGDLGVMTAGRGISHSEYSEPNSASNDGLLGVQLWVALPDTSRDVFPQYEFHADLPTTGQEGFQVRLFFGSYGGQTAAATTYSPILGAELLLSPGEHRIPDLRTDFEHGVLVISGSATIQDTAVGPGALLYVEPGAGEITVACTEPARLMLLGGEPLEEDLLMWWNFVGRTNDEMIQAREQWQQGSRFGRVVGDDTPPLPAPPMPSTPLIARSGRPGSRG